MSIYMAYGVGDPMAPSETKTMALQSTVSSPPSGLETAKSGLSLVGVREICKASSQHRLLSICEFCYGDYNPIFGSSAAAGGPGAETEISLSTLSAIRSRPTHHPVNLNLTEEIVRESLTDFATLHFNQEDDGSAGRGVVALALPFLTDRTLATIYTLAKEFETTLLLLLLHPLRELQNSPRDVADVVSSLLVGRTVKSTVLKGEINVHFGGIGPVIEGERQWKDQVLLARGIQSHFRGGSPPPLIFIYTENREVSAAENKDDDVSSLLEGLDVIQINAPKRLRNAHHATSYTPSKLFPWEEAQRRSKGSVEPLWPYRGASTGAFAESSDRTSTGPHLPVSGLFFKTDYRQYGGDGVARRFERLRPVTEGWATPNPMEVLGWSWQPPEAEARKAMQIVCDLCKKSFELEDGDEPFKKFNFVYCSTSCVASHRDLNFKII